MKNLSFCGRIDSTNAQAFGRRLAEALEASPEESLVLDFDGVEYISSMGLRALLEARKKAKQPLSVINAAPAVYEILEMTGFTSMLKVEKKLREIDITGCEVIGHGAVGTVYRIDRETIVKVYEIPNALEMIKNEQRRAKQALLRGVPTAISYDAVRVGSHYGSVFELVNARTFTEVLRKEPDRLEELVRLHADMIRQLHSIEADPGELPDCRDIFEQYLAEIGDAIPEELRTRLRKMFRAMAPDRHLIHGDIHMKNVMFCDGEPLWIDMDTLSCGNPVFDLANLFVAYHAFNEHDPGNSLRFIGLPQETCARLWDRTVSCTLGLTDAEKLRRAMDRAKAVGYVRFLYLVVVMNMGGEELREARIRSTTEHLLELLETVGSFEI